MPRIHVRLYRYRRGSGDPENTARQLCIRLYDRHDRAVGYTASLVEALAYLHTPGAGFVELWEMGVKYHFGRSSDRYRSTSVTMITISWNGDTYETEVYGPHLSPDVGDIDYTIDPLPARPDLEAVSRRFLVRRAPQPI